VLSENSLSSHVDDGENEGKQLHHDYVVRQFYGPFTQSKTGEHTQTPKLIRQSVLIDQDWQQRELSLVAFAQNPRTGEILQAVRLSLGDEI
jgi:hypothetical protein